MTEDSYIRKISKTDKLLEFMDEYKITALRYATVEQLQEYCDANGIK